MHEPFHNKTIALGVSGGIAAYKSVELLRLLTKAEARVRVIMTANAKWFVGPGTFQALSGLPVCTSVFEEGDASIRHIDWARETDLAVIAPATANIIGKLANGIADDALTTFMLAVTAPVMICPAMNTHMYEHPAVQHNLDILQGFGHRIVEPDAGSLACGTVGPGRLAAPADIFEQAAGVLTPQDLKARTVLVTAGPTRETIDPVRFVSNASSGKMGFALAQAAIRRGARVILVTGPVALPDPLQAEVHRVTSAAEMADCVLAQMPAADVIIKTAAVADYRPVQTAEQKIKKTADRLSVAFERTTDILKTIGEQKANRVLVGFAAETQHLQDNARQKLAAKNLDLIVANRIGESGSGFAADTNRVTLFFRDGREEGLPLMAKDALAHALLDRVVPLLPAA
ncbi:MAG: bifunctional phosphopantothenoylcysteine decarboxylase/phosphopantothenate--cysteine ligase CoaBC [Desulfobacterales bacterium]|nr:bifunctional phosphopantothenoylcysteine decarboxylase/phosphopantothenate--cysteine ligase CoaBC [Desulfobacterales bacterium]